MDGVVNISCDYVGVYNDSGCFYQFSSTYKSISGLILGMNYHIVSIDVSIQYNLTVTDVNDMDVITTQMIKFSSIPFCYTTTGQISICNILI